MISQSNNLIKYNWELGQNELEIQVYNLGKKS